MRETQIRVANVLLEIDAVKFTPQNPITFKSGIRSPVYVDNRTIPYWPRQWRTIITAFRLVVEAEGDPYEIIAGIETAGIPHSSALAYSMSRPSVFVRKQPKEHGTKSRIEGGDVAGKRVMLVEDLVTTGSSSLSGIHALRDSGAIAEDCIAIVSYGFKEAIESFTEAGVRLHTLTTFNIIIEQAQSLNKFSPQDTAIIHDWLQDPHGWAGRYGFS
ncbi:MAG: orotate phosphoribosyltransferase [Anaerolineae bacterium]